jgi:isocitrate dehydrogenase
MFEAIHGSAPRRAGQNLANPSGLLLGAVMMLVHIRQTDVAERVHNAWLRTIEDGVHTYDIHEDGVSRQKVGTREFAQAVVARLGQRPEKLKTVSYASAPGPAIATEHPARAAEKKELVGVDVVLQVTGGHVDRLAAQLRSLTGTGLQLTTISNRGVKVYPDGNPGTFTVDQWACRFMAAGAGTPVTHVQVISVLQRLAEAGFDFVMVENLYTFNGERGYSLGQGE